MDYQMMAIVLLFVGIALMLAEFFIPSGGMIGILSAICMIISFWAAFKIWWGSTYFWIYIVSVLVIVPGALVGMLRLIESTPLGNRILLTGPAAEEVTPYQQEQARLKALVGKTGKTATLFNPGGIVMIDGERLHAFSEGLLIAAGEMVEITGVQGNRLVVRPAWSMPQSSATPEVDLKVPEPESPAEPPAPPPAKAPESSGNPWEDLPPLDFEMPAR